VTDLFDAAVTQLRTLLDFAIKLKYSRQFNEAYEQLTAGRSPIEGRAGAVCQC
jgi:hypothetical protein